MPTSDLGTGNFFSFAIRAARKTSVPVSNPATTYHNATTSGGSTIVAQPLPPLSTTLRKESRQLQALVGQLFGQTLQYVHSDVHYD